MGVPRAMIGCVRACSFLFRICVVEDLQLPTQNESLTFQKGSKTYSSISQGTWLFLLKLFEDGYHLDGGRSATNRSVILHTVQLHKVIQWE